MYIINKDNVIEIYPFAATEEQIGSNGSVVISKDKDCAPDVAGRLQLRIVFPTGATLEQWKKLKDAGDKAFSLAGIVVEDSILNLDKVHGCHDCGREMYPKRVRNFLVCPDCISENIVCIQK